MRITGSFGRFVRAGFAALVGLLICAILLAKGPPSGPALDE